MRIFWVLLIILNSSLATFSQTKNLSISGHVEDAKTGEKLIGATIYDSKTQVGVVTNNYGFYSLNIPKDSMANLVISFVGYSSLSPQIRVAEDQTMNFHLTSGSELAEVVVLGSKEKPIERRNEMGVLRIPMKDAELLPSLGGEPDIIKALQSMPGVQSGTEASSNFFVRGGSPDQNLMLLDDVPLYYVNHLGGFVSIFNTDAIKDVKLIKGGFPAHYGSRLSSVVDIRMKDGNVNEFDGSGMLGIVASKITVEGPIKKDTTSYIISVRRMLLDLLMQPLSRIVFNGYGFGYHFYDFNAKINHRLSDKDHLFLSAYIGNDILGANFKIKNENEKYKFKGHFRWGNNLFALRWNHIYNHKLFSNLTLSYTRYRYFTDASHESVFNNEKEYSFNSFASGVFDVGAKIDFEYFTNAKNKLKFGVGSVYHIFKPGLTRYLQKENDRLLNEKTFGKHQRVNGIETTAYIEDELSMGNRMNANIGLRFSSYIVNRKNYSSIEPRILVNFLLKDDLAIKGSYAKMQQNIHLLTSTGRGMPIDLWMPATDKAAPEQSWQWALGIAQSMKNGQYELSVEGYYKKMQNLITYKPGASILGASTVNWENKVETKGDGNAYGLEFLVQKKQGKTTGWIGYTLSKSDRHFTNLNQGKRYPFKYDRRHDLSVVVIHRLNERIDLSATWVYGTGNVLTLAVGHYDVVENLDNSTYPHWLNLSGSGTYKEVYIYSEKNNFRMRDFHRLNVGINFHKKKKWGERTWNLSIYNLYNRQNPYYYYFEDGAEYDDFGNLIPGTDRLVLKQQSLFPIIPSASYSFRF